MNNIITEYKLRHLLIDVDNKSDFVTALENGQINNDLIAFIKSSNEIWTQGHYYNCNGASVDDIIDVINNNPDRITLDDAVINLIQEWALKPTSEIPNRPNIPANKIPGGLTIPGTLSNGTFTPVIGDATNPNNIYLDTTSNKLYKYGNGLYVELTTSGGDFTLILSDWELDDNTQVDYIKNKPDIAGIQADITTITQDLGTINTEIANIWLRINGGETPNYRYYFVASDTKPSLSQYQDLLNTNIVPISMTVPTGSKLYALIPVDNNITLDFVEQSDSPFIPLMNNEDYTDDELYKLIYTGVNEGASVDLTLTLT